VLKPYVARRKPEYTYSRFMMELVVREGLKGALVGREEKQLFSVVKFVNMFLADSSFSTMMLHVAILVDRALLVQSRHEELDGTTMSS